MVLLDNGGGVRDAHLAAPPADLRRSVEHVWTQPHSTDAGEWRVVPDASPHLIAAVVETPRGRLVKTAFVGPRSQMAVIDLRGRVFTAGVRLRPGAIPMLLPASAGDLADRAVAFDDVFGGRILRDLEISADAPPAVIAAELLRIVRRAARAPSSGSFAHALEQLMSVRSVAEALAMPERTLRDRAVRQIGLTPKRTLRILRLHRALFAARIGEASWAAVACAAGYADQAHLTRECRELLGDTPSRWVARGLADSFKTDALAAP